MNAEQHEFMKQIYHEMYDQLLGYAYSSLQNHGQAEEAVQEAFQIACRKPDELMYHPNPRGWMTLTVKNTVRNLKHQLDRDHRFLAAYLATQSTQVAISEDQISIEVNYGNIVHLEEYKLLADMVLHGKSQLEMALERGISLSACKKRVQRAKETLRTFLE